MYDLSKKYNLDSTKESEGVWEPLGGNSELLIARIGNSNYQKAYGKIPNAIRIEIDNKTIDDEEGAIIFSSLLAKTILLNWKGIADKGKEIKYTEKAATEYLIKYPDFRNLIIELANTRERFHKDEVENDIKN